MRRVILKKLLSEVLIAFLAENHLIPHIQVVFFLSYGKEWLIPSR
jgi:hypothetical protein